MKKQSKILFPLLLVLALGSGIYYFEFVLPTEQPDPNDQPLIPPPSGEVERTGTRVTTPEEIASKGTLLRGRVLDAYRNPIAGAQVKVKDASELSSIGGQATTDAQGNFAFELQANLPDPSRAHMVPVESVLFEAPSFSLNIEAEGYQPLHQSDIAITSGEVNELGDFLLTAIMRLYGRVFDPQGQPFPDASIRLQSLAKNPDGSPRRTEQGFVQGVKLDTWSGAAGAYEFKDQSMREGVFLIEAYGAGVGGFRGELTLPYTGAFDIHLTQRSGISGVCVDRKGNPIPEVRVQLRSVHQLEDGRQLVREMHSDSKGRFGFFDLPSERFVVSGFANPSRFFIEGATENAPIELLPPVEVRLVAQDEHFGSIRGRVLDALTREPLQDFHIQGTFNVEQGQYGLRRPLNVHSRDGNFALPLLPKGVYEFVVSAKGYDTYVDAQVEVSEGNAVLIGDVLLWPHGELSGVVKDNQGNPIAGAQVQVFKPGVRAHYRLMEQTRRSGGTYRPNRAPEAAPQGRVRSGAGLDPIASGTTDAEGRYRLTGVPSGKQVMVVRYQRQAQEREVNLAQSLQRPPEDFSLPATGTLKLHVRNSHQDILIGATVAVVRDGLAPDAGMLLRSDEDGVIELTGLSPGTYAIWASRNEVNPSDVYVPHQAGELQSVQVKSGEVREMLVELPAFLQITFTLKVGDRLLTNQGCYLVPPLGKGQPRGLTTSESGQVVVSDGLAGVWKVRTNFQDTPHMASVKVEDSSPIIVVASLEPAEPAPREVPNPPRER